MTKPGEGKGVFNRTAEALSSLLEAKCDEIKRSREAPAGLALSHILRSAHLSAGGTRVFRREVGHLLVQLIIPIHVAQEPRKASLLPGMVNTYFGGSGPRARVSGRRSGWVMEFRADVQ